MRDDTIFDWRRSRKLVPLCCTSSSFFCSFTICLDHLFVQYLKGIFGLLLLHNSDVGCHAALFFLFFFFLTLIPNHARATSILGSQSWRQTAPHWDNLPASRVFRLNGGRCHYPTAHKSARCAASQSGRCGDAV